TAEFIHLRHDLAICTYEAAKIAQKSSSETSDVTDRFNAIATAKSISGASVSVSPSLSSSTASGTDITLTATVPTAGNYSLPFRIFGGVTLTAIVVVVRQST
ncbi:MAG: hypothetical protein KDA78_20385, partial [Planctomycetaceae bacterium]|nr:hypothetical protein [Planctomycetaceae bacterium]